MHRTCFRVPSFIVAYNAFMSGVCRLDQKRATNATKRRERKVYMSIFTYVLDLACTQAHALFVFTQTKTKKNEKLFDFVEFKCQIAQDLVVPWRCVNNKVTPVVPWRCVNNKVTPEKQYCLHSDNQRKEPLPNKLYLPQPPPKAPPKKRTTDEDVGVEKYSHPSPKRKMLPVHEVMGTNLHTHMLISNIGKKATTCFFCGFRKIKKRTFYRCVECKKGYCVDCFTAYHCAGALKGQPKMLAEMIIKSECGLDGLPRAHNRACKHVGTIADLVLHETTIVKTNVITAVPVQQSPRKWKETNTNNGNSDVVAMATPTQRKSPRKFNNNNNNNNNNGSNNGSKNSRRKK
jgi:hypothetical protein